MDKIKTRTRRTITKLTRFLRKFNTSKLTKQSTGKMGSLPDVDFGFPNEPLWTNLIERARTITEPIINDTTLGAQISLAQLLYDVAHMRVILLQHLPADALESSPDGGKLMKASAPYIALTTAPNYEFYVGLLSILSIGAAPSPARLELAPDETLQVFRGCNITTIISGPNQLSSSEHLRQLATAQNHSLSVLPLTLTSLTSLNTPSSLLPFSIDPSVFHIRPTQTIPDPFPGVVMRGTGTTGAPKTVVLPRRMFYRTPPVKSDGLALIFESLDWTSGNMALMMHTLNGRRAEIVPTKPGPAFIWKRLRKGDVTSMTDYAQFWEELAEYYQREIAPLSEAEREPYIRGATGLKAPLITGSAPSPGLMKFWKETFGLYIHVGFVATELGEVSLMTMQHDEYRQGMVGREFQGSTVKLSHGDRGEFLIKTGYLFMHYINDPERTRNAFTEDGFFKTGDYGHREGDLYFFDGRIGTDLIEFGTEVISLVFVDQSLLVHSESVSEHCVVNIPATATSGPALGILARFKDHVSEQAAQEIQEDMIRRVREQTHGRLPVQFRVLQKDEKFVWTFNMKPWRRLIVDAYFS